jgi:HSP90 family molecular chaperone
LTTAWNWPNDEESGQQGLRVTDNGVGMTEKVIKNYFTQVGKSYYRKRCELP